MTNPRRTTPNRACPDCGGGGADQSAIRYSREGWTIKSCPDCRFIFLENAPDYQTLESDFSWERTYSEARIERQKELSDRAIERTIRAFLVHVRRFANTMWNRNKLASLSSQHLVSGTVLDLGCGSGRFVNALPAGCCPVGIEISERLAEIARPSFEERGGRVIHANVLAGLRSLPDASCSGAVARSYLEHELQPKLILGELRRVLRPGARVIVKVPNYQCWNRRVRGGRWCGFRLPDHVNYFTPRSLVRLLGHTDFRIVRFGMMDRLPTSDNMWCVAEKRSAAQHVTSCLWTRCA